MQDKSIYRNVTILNYKFMVFEFDFSGGNESFDSRKKGYVCPCCNQYVKLYRRHFNSNMAVALLFLYRNRHRSFIHLENEMKACGYKRCGDASYLRHYKFIEVKKEKREDGSNRNGMYKISGLGILFCEMKSKAREYFLTFNNSCEGFDGEEIDILKALGRKFNYSELISPVN